MFEPLVGTEAPSSPFGVAWTNRLAHLHTQLTQQGLPGLGTPLMGEPLPALRWAAFNRDLMDELGWASDWMDDMAASNHALAVLSGNGAWQGMAPMATVYSGHQFGVWAGQLGDGRAMLLGEVDSQRGPQELQLKGSGPTPYSRRGDGRAVLRSSIREYLCSEAMHGLGIPTTRALALTVSPQVVWRETAETAAVVTRVAPSFIRFGHFEHFAYVGDEGATQTLKALVDFVIQHHYPDLVGAEQPALALLEAVVDRTAGLMAAWQAVGFCHGVMNTDNMSILGLTVDYGPYGFLDAFNPDHICNHSDHQGRYSWNNQPQIGYWNLRALANALVPLIPEAKEDPARVVSVLQRYEGVFPRAMRARWRAKLGLLDEQDDDAKLAIDFLQLMAQSSADFTITFRRLCDWRSDLAVDDPCNALVRDLFLDRAAFDAWAQRYQARLATQGEPDAVRAERMRGVNPLYVLRNHMAEQAIRRAQAGDFDEVLRLQTLLRSPFTEQAGAESDAGFPPDWAQSIEVSCSS